MSESNQEHIIKNFKDFAIKRNDIIDNTFFELASNVYNKKDSKILTESAKTALHTLALQSPNCNLETKISADMCERMVQCTKVIINEYKDKNPTQNDELEWNMSFIGEMCDTAESMLQDYNIPTCHPFFIDEDETPCALNDYGCDNRKDCPFNKTNDIEIPYQVSMSVSGFITITVNAKSPEDAIQKANTCVEEKDFGELSEIQWTEMGVEWNKE